MAHKGLVAKTEQRRQVARKYADKRRALRVAGDYTGLQRLPRDVFPTRLKNRCRATSRERGYLRAFGVSRVVLREKPHAAELPGVRKARP